MAGNPDKFESAFETYDVTRIMGEGGAGRVFEVRDSAGKSFAVKCLHPHLTTTERKKRFKNEIDFCKKRPHRNIIHVVDSGLVEFDKIKVPFYVMPLSSGTLRDLLEKKLPPERVLPMFSQILDGVEAGHLLGVFHRDLKPENILYDSEADLILIADFGIAHFEEEILATAVETKQGAKMANLGYSAPEQRMKGGQVDSRADIYALGLILNEMFTGHVPQGVGFATIAANASQFSYLDDLVAAMIQQQAAARPATIEEIKKQLMARQNQFVALQKLDAKRKEVIPVAAAGRVGPVNVVGGDWDNNTLTLQLDRAPEPGWIQRFQQPRESISYIGGTHPSMFQFAGKFARINAEERYLQQVVDQFKTWSPIATRSFQADLDEKSAREEQQTRDQLKRELEAAETRQRALKNVKF